MLRVMSSNPLAGDEPVELLTPEAVAEKLRSDALLASVLRKFVASENTYATWAPGSLTLDGHIGKRMTADENAALERLFIEADEPRGWRA